MRKFSLALGLVAVFITAQGCAGKFEKGEWEFYRSYDLFQTNSITTSQL